MIKITKKGIELETMGYVILSLIVLVILIGFIMIMKGGYGVWIDKIKDLFTW